MQLRSGFYDSTGYQLRGCFNWQWVRHTAHRPKEQLDAAAGYAAALLPFYESTFGSVYPWGPKLDLVLPLPSDQTLNVSFWLHLVNWSGGTNLLDACTNKHCWTGCACLGAPSTEF